MAANYMLVMQLVENANDYSVGN